MFEKSYHQTVTYVVEEMLPAPSMSPTKFLAALHPVAELLAFIYNENPEEVEHYIIEEAKDFDEDYDRSSDE